MKPTDSPTPTITMFAILRDDGKYYGGFDVTQGVAIATENLFAAKLHTSKHDVKVLENERLVEVTIALTPDTVSVSAPFKPRPRRPRSTSVTPSQGA